VDSKAFITGCAGTALTDAEREFFACERPCGLIVFARNVESPAQLRALVADFKEAVGRGDVLTLVDQEGGRVQRMRPPHWRNMPPARCYGQLYETDPDAAKRAAFAGARLIAAQVHDAGLNVNCTPCIDVPQAGAHDIIGDRAFSTDPDVVSALGRAVMDGTLAGGVLPVIKHVPGHGRALADSHKSLPRIDATKEELEAADFRPFQALHDAPLAMTAHVLLPVFDERRPATVSPVIMDQVTACRLPIMRLKSDDFPTLGRPTIATVGMPSAVRIPVSSERPALRAAGSVPERRRLAPSRGRRPRRAALHSSARALPPPPGEPR
jgi:beta-N-acetylhexosaminidase